MTKTNKKLLIIKMNIIKNENTFKKILREKIL